MKVHYKVREHVKSRIMFALYMSIVHSSSSGNIFGIYVIKGSYLCFNIGGGHNNTSCIYISIQYYKSQPIKARKVFTL